MFRTVPLSIIRSFSLYTQQWYMSYKSELTSRIRTYVLILVRPDPARKLRNAYSFFYFYCYTVHVVELLNYYTNHCTYIKFTH